MFGDFLFFWGVISILAQSFGYAANNARIVLQKRYDSKNGDYIVYLFGTSVISILVLLVILIFNDYRSAFTLAILSIITMISIFRLYSDVEFRLKQNFKKYFVYYVVLAIGYILGLIIYYLTGCWPLVLILGEGIVVLWMIIRGEYYRKPFALSGNFKLVVQECIVLSFSYLLSYTMMNLDRVILKMIIGSEAVSTYYVLSLLGKSMALMVAPLNSVIISRLSLIKPEMKTKIFPKLFLAAFVVSILFTFIATICTPPFQNIFYPEYNKTQLLLIFIVNSGQILYLMSTLLLVVVLTMIDTKWQLIIQMVYSLLFLLTAFPLTLNYGLFGFAVASAVANFFRFILTGVIGLLSNRRLRAGGV